jgi:hypothetical protein
VSASQRWPLRGWRKANQERRAADRMSNLRSGDKLGNDDDVMTCEFNAGAWMTLEDRMLVRMPHQDREGQAEAARGLVLVHNSARVCA